MGIVAVPDGNLRTGPRPSPPHPTPPARRAVPNGAPGPAGLLRGGALENTAVSHPKSRLTLRVERFKNAKGVAACP